MHLFLGAEKEEHFKNCNGQCSMNIQTIVDASCKFSNVIVRWPGATPDNYIFSNSKIKTKCEAGDFKDGVLLGDNSYHLTRYLLTPVCDPKTQQEIIYNDAHSRTRSVMLEAMGIWKKRFPILTIELKLKLDTVQAIIVATAVLHNLAIDMGDNEPDGDLYQEEIDDDELNIEFDDDHTSDGLELRERLITEHFPSVSNLCEVSCV